jgi:hypothetical protein
MFHDDLRGSAGLSSPASLELVIDRTGHLDALTPA